MRLLIAGLVFGVFGCAETSRNVPEVDYLTEIDSRLETNDVCGVRRYILSKPRAVQSDEAFERELREFVRNTQQDCALGDTEGSDSPASSSADAPVTQSDPEPDETLGPETDVAVGPEETVTEEEVAAGPGRSDQSRRGGNRRNENRDRDDDDDDDDDDEEEDDD